MFGMAGNVALGREDMLVTAEVVQKIIICANSGTCDRLPRMDIVLKGMYEIGHERNRCKGLSSDCLDNGKKLWYKAFEKLSLWET